MAGVSVTKTPELTNVLIGIVTKVISPFQSAGKTSVNRVESAHSVSIMQPFV